MYSLLDRHSSAPLKYRFLLPDGISLYDIGGEMGDKLEELSGKWNISLITDVLNCKTIYVMSFENEETMIIMKMIFA